MMMIVTAHRLYVLLGLGLIGLGLFVLVHPELARGGSLILLGLAMLERVSGRTRRLFDWISSKANHEPPLGRRGRRAKPAAPGPACPRPEWHPVW